MTANNMASHSQQARWQLLLTLLGDDGSGIGDETVSNENELNIDTGIRDSLILTRSRLEARIDQDRDRIPTRMNTLNTEEAVGDDEEKDLDILTRDSILLNQRRLQASEGSKIDSKNHSISAPLAALPKPEKPNIYKYAPQA